MGDLQQVARLLAARLPVTPCATMQVSCSAMPGGARRITSGSVVGLPGGTRNPMLVQPIMERRLKQKRLHSGLLAAVSW
jgi:hypothetical protein